MGPTEKQRETLDRDFRREETAREDLEMYEKLLHRGSYRLSQGLMRTESEQREFIQQGRRAKLPNPKEWRFLSMLKRLFR